MLFTYKDYFRHIDALRQCGYKIIGYRDQRQDKNVILRHDVDFSLKQAAEFSKKEAEYGVRSTYFVLIRSDFYNLFSKQSHEFLQTILDGGHEIGLHFDEKCYDIDNCFEALNEAVMWEKGQLEQALGQSVYSVSMHQPSQFILDGDFSVNHLVNSCSQEFIRNWKFLSDSRMNWSENAMDAITCGQHRNLHILTHPFWYAEREEDMHAKLNELSRQQRLSNILFWITALDNYYKDMNDVHE